MERFGFWGNGAFIFFVIWIVCGIYARYVPLPYKRDEDADFGEMDVETLKKRLKERLEYPYCKSIIINEAGRIELACKYATYDVKIEDRKLVIEDKFRLFSKGEHIRKEKNCLEAYLVKALVPETDVNPPKTLGYFRRYIKAHILGRVAGCLLFISAVFCFLNEYELSVMDVVDIWKSKGVSYMGLSEYSDEITIGEALRVACPAGKWSSDKIDKGLYRVSYSGYGMNGSLLTIVFQSKDWSKCTIQSISIDGQDYSLLEGMFLAALFENAESVDSSGQIDEQGLLEAADEYIEEDDLTTDYTETIVEDNVDLSEQLNEMVDDFEINQTLDEEVYDSEVQGAAIDILDARYIDSVTASSELMDGNNFYKADAIFDGKEDTCWAEGVNGNGEGEYIEIYFTESMYIKEICFLNGYIKNEDVFNKNGKIKRVEVTFSDGYTYEQALGDWTYNEVEEQSFDDRIYFDEAICTEYLKVTILEAEAGEKYSDTCLSELILWGYPKSAIK